MHPEIDKFAYLRSPIHVWEPRLKLVSCGILIGTTATLSSLSTVGLAGLITVGLVAVSRIPFGFNIRRLSAISLFFIPFYILLPLTSVNNIVFEFSRLQVSLSGLILAFLIHLKALIIITITIVGLGTASFETTMKALDRLWLPNTLVQMILFAYRYLFVFMEELQRISRAQQARGFIRRTNWFTFTVLGNTLGMLLVRSFERTDRIYKAMQARGYTGTFRLWSEFQTNRWDWFKAFILVTLSMVLFIGEIWIFS